MRSWIRALIVLHRDYPFMRGEIHITEDGITIRVSRDFNGKRAAISTIVNGGVEDSVIDLVQVELARATSQLLLFPENHVVKLGVVT